MFDQYSTTMQDLATWRDLDLDLDLSVPCPLSVFIDKDGQVKLGDFGFAKVLENGNRTYTFCGTPGYVAPENVLAHGYNFSVDWWGLGVVMYVLLTGRQPFSTPKTDDPMVVMRRIVDENYLIKYPPYVSHHAKDVSDLCLDCSLLLHSVTCSYDLH